MHSPVLKFEPGEWYLVVTCKQCGFRQPMIHDLSRGKSSIDASYQWCCPMCEHLDAYHGTDVERYEHART